MSAARNCRYFGRCTAKAIGVELLTVILLRADEVIE
jgi:hypothetical protein